MRTPIPWTLYADRGIAFSDTIPIVGVDFTGATYRCQVRDTPDATGSALASPTASLTYGGSDTVAHHVTAGRLSAAIYVVKNAATGANYVGTDNVAMSLITISLSRAATLAFPPAAEPGDNAMLAWDLLITPSGQTEDKWVYGPFVLRGTVTQ